MTGLHDMPMGEYLADPCPEPSLSSSIIAELTERSPRHAWAKHPRLNPDREPDDTAGTDLGSAAHAMLSAHNDTVVFLSFDSWRTNESKAKRDEVRAAGLIPLLEKEKPRLVAMATAALKKINASHDLQGVFSFAKSEQTLIWQSGGVWFKARPDYLSDDKRIILDYKTTEGSANPNNWNPAKFGYDIQAALYVDGVRAVCETGATFFWLVQENDPPYECAIVSPSEQVLEVAREKIRVATKVWKKCLKENHWPGYSDLTYYVDYPAYEVTKWDIAKILLEGMTNK